MEITSYAFQGNSFGYNCINLIEFYNSFLLILTALLLGNLENLETFHASVSTFFLQIFIFSWNRNVKYSLPAVIDDTRGLHIRLVKYAVGALLSGTVMFIVIVRQEIDD